jgi:hypothetical protein
MLILILITTCSFTGAILLSNADISVDGIAFHLNSDAVKLYLHDNNCLIDKLTSKVVAGAFQGSATIFLFGGGLSFGLVVVHAPLQWGLGFLLGQGVSMPAINSAALCSIEQMAFCFKKFFLCCTDLCLIVEGAQGN